MLCYILAQYAPQVHENILLFFRHKKQSHRNCCRILNINLVIGICKFNTSKLQILPRPEFTLICIYKSNTSKLQMLPTLTRHLQVQNKQIADTSDPDQASANPNPASCRYFRPRPGICCSPKQQIKDTHRWIFFSNSPVGIFISSLLYLYFIK